MPEAQPQVTHTPTPADVEEKKEVSPKEEKVEEVPIKEEGKQPVHHHHNKPLPPKPAVVAVEEKSPTPPAQTSPNASQEVKVPELALTDSKKKERGHRKTASNLPPTPTNDQVTKQRSSTISVVNVNQATAQEKEKIPAELAHLSPRGKKEKRSSKRVSKNLSKEKEKEKEKDKKDKLKEKEKVKSSSDSLKKSLSDAKGLNDSKKKKSSKSNKGMTLCPSKFGSPTNEISLLQTLT